MFSYFNSFLDNPREMLIFLLLSTPGRLMALSLHELAHALEHQERYEAAALISEGLNFFRDGNDKLEAALEQLKEEN